jgi:hypothetical protein
MLVSAFFIAVIADHSCPGGLFDESLIMSVIADMINMSIKEDMYKICLGLSRLDHV